MMEKLKMDYGEKNNRTDRLKNINLKTLSRQDAVKLMEEWIKYYPKLPVLKENEKILREILIEKFNSIRKEKDNRTGRVNYILDVKMGLALYEILWEIPQFNMRWAADDGFWRYLSLQIIPDVVGERWDYKNADHYWKRPVRIWLRSIWWYIHMSWQGNIKDTEELLVKECFDTDTILNLGERTGRNGIFIDVSRIIMKKFSTISKQKKTNSKEKIFRKIMKINTARMVVIEPGLYDGGENGYVDSVFELAGIEIA